MTDRELIDALEAEKISMNDLLKRDGIWHWYDWGDDAPRGWRKAAGFRDALENLIKADAHCPPNWRDLPVMPFP
jgi:hypothetical protein